MKVMVYIAALFMTVTIAAQEKPKFEKENDLVKGTFYFENGQIQQQGTYKDGKLHGEWISYDHNGDKVAKGYYENGIKTGKWFFWNEEKLSEVDYSNNKITEVNTWINTNNVVSN